MNKTIIKTERLYKNYGTVNVLNNINVEIFEGDFTVIMGSSGSGKSTLLYSLSSMDSPTNGKIELMGRDIAKLEEDDLTKIRKKTISFIFQSINLIPDLTAFENIAYPSYLVMPKSDANKRAEQLLKDFDLAGHRNKYPNELSGGQQQRIAIIRAIACNPKVVFADEPTGSLNSKAGTQVLDLLTQLNKEGQSVVMVTHDIKASVRGNRILFLADGQIAGDLNLGLYDPSAQEAREKNAFQFLNKYQL
jgi:putative ABC transport system ATP-binding protein